MIDPKKAYNNLPTLPPEAWINWVPPIIQWVRHCRIHNKRTRQWSCSFLLWWI